MGVGRELMEYGREGKVGMGAAVSRMYVAEESKESNKMGIE